MSGNQLSDDTQLSTLLKVVPAQLRNHLQLSMDEDADYSKIREKVISYERATASWPLQAVHRELDIKEDERDEAVPMEVVRVKGKVTVRVSRRVSPRQLAKMATKGKENERTENRSPRTRAKARTMGMEKVMLVGEKERGACGQKGRWGRECPGGVCVRQLKVPHQLPRNLW